MAEIFTVTIGATKSEGGSRAHVIKIGGEWALPGLFKDGPIPNKPQIAFEVWDIPTPDWPDPFARAKKCVDSYGAKILCVRLMGAHPDSGDKGRQEEAEFIRKMLKTVPVPLIITGCSDDNKDNAIIPACSEAAKGERCLIGSAVQDNYKTICASLLADGHSIIAESPIDINIAKQLNILISDMGLPLERIVINPTIGALGYGLEYAYSIMERARLAAFSGDKTVGSPFICFVGQEAWKAKEAKSQDARQGVMWEVLTATALIHAGADLLVMRNHEAAQKVSRYIEELFPVCS